MNYLFSFALIWFSIFFLLFHFLFKKKLNKKILFIVLLFVLLALFNKTNLGLFAGNVDPAFHLNPENIKSGFPLFFVSAFVFNFIGLEAFYFMPLFFGALLFYVFVVWCSEKDISYPILAIALISISSFNYVYFSFSRSPVFAALAIALFYFLEKFKSEDKDKFLLISLILLILCLFTKVVGFILIPLFLWFVKDRKKVFLFISILLGVIVAYGLFFTNLPSNLNYFTWLFNLKLISIETFIYLLHAFPILILTILPFFNRKRVLWQICFYGLIAVWLYGFASTFLFYDIELHANLTTRRYFLFLQLPAILWLSSEADLFVKKQFDKYDIIF